jgi:hypothetical protein
MPSEDGSLLPFMYLSLLGHAFASSQGFGKTCTDGLQTSNTTGSTCGLGGYKNSINQIISSLGFGNLIVSNYTTNTCQEAVYTSFIAVTQVINI